MGGLSWHPYKRVSVPTRLHTNHWSIKYLWKWVTSLYSRFLSDISSKLFVCWYLADIDDNVTLHMPNNCTSTAVCVIKYWVCVTLCIFCYQWRINVEMGVVIVTVASHVSSSMVFKSVWMVQVGIIWVSNPYEIQIQNESVCYCHRQTICSRTIVIESMSRKQLCLQHTRQTSLFSQESPIPWTSRLMHACMHYAGDNLLFNYAISWNFNVSMINKKFE